MRVARVLRFPSPCFVPECSQNTGVALFFFRVVGSDGHLAITVEAPRAIVNTISVFIVVIAIEAGAVLGNT